MAGHSKWANIKHKKAKEDAKRGKAFTKLSKEITVAARLSGGDPSANPRLRLLIEKGRSINMPMENITRAIKKGTGELPGVSYEPRTYEGYGPFGTAVLVETLTDNTNRTVAEMRRLFTKHGGNLGETGSVNWMFEQKGVIRAETKLSEDELLELLIDFDISDIKKQENLAIIISDIKSLEQIKKIMVESNAIIESSDLEWIAKTPTELSKEQEEKVYTFLEILDDHDDVQNVYSNVA